MRQLSGFLMLAMLAGCARESGPRKYPVRGTVTINGQPAVLVRVQFHHADQSLPGNLKSPVGMTNETGEFHLSTSGNKDGAVEGEYTVTFEWMSDNDVSAFDKLGGRFANPVNSKFKVRIEPSSTTLDAFELTIPEAEIRTRPPRGQP